MITEIDAIRCTGCGLCAALCNMDVLRLNEKNSTAEIAYQEDCMTCFECALKCPEEAITVRYTPGYVPPSIELKREQD